MPGKKFNRTCKGTKQKRSGPIRLKEKGRNTMNNPTRQTNRSITMGAKFALLALLTGIAVTSPTWLIGRAAEKHHAIVYRWDLIHLTPMGTNNVLDAGGVASDKAANGSQITLTGSGTWLAISGHEKSQAVTGGGTWVTFDSSGTNSTGSGTYEVTRLVRFDVVPGSTPAVGGIDNIASAEDSRAGLVILRIHYSDGEEGVLTISCHGGGPVPAPDTVFEGITVTKGFVGYVDRGKPAPGVDANRTVFHVVAEGQVDDDDDDDDD